MSKEQPIVLSSPDRSLGGSGNEQDDASDDDTYNPGYNTSDADDEEGMYDNSNEDIITNTEGTADSYYIDHTHSEYRLHSNEFLRRATTIGFNGIKAISML